MDIGILPSGYVVDRSHWRDNKLVGQIVVIDGYLTAFALEDTNHSILWEGLLEPALSSFELKSLKKRVKTLEEILFR